MGFSPSFFSTVWAAGSVLQRLGGFGLQIFGFLTLFGYIKFKKIGEEQRETKPITQQCFAKGYSKARSSE